MNSATAESILKVLQKSLLKEPGQFLQVNVSVIGSVFSGGAAPGAVISGMTGGTMQGGTVVGLVSSASADGTNVQVEKLEAESKELGLELAVVVKEAIQAVHANDGKARIDGILGKLGRFGSNVATAMIAWTLQTWLKAQGLA